MWCILHDHVPSSLAKPAQEKALRIIMLTSFGGVGRTPSKMMVHLVRGTTTQKWIDIAEMQSWATYFI